MAKKTYIINKFKQKKNGLIGDIKCKFDNGRLGNIPIIDNQHLYQIEIQLEKAGYKEIK